MRSFGPEFRYLDLGADATPTPATRSTAASRIAAGEAIAFMIDGAHVLTPGVLRYGMAGLADVRARDRRRPSSGTSVPASSATRCKAGYDQAYEDELFREIEWPLDGYRLFDIGHFIGDRDWFDGLWESNCIFVPRKLLEQVGGVRRELLDAGRRLREPRALRAARRARPTSTS